jgi:steroid 5-alpha reductase family enzyme
MFLLLTRVTGIPMAEEQSLKSRGDEYRAYQKRTNAFFLWFPKKEQV